MDALFTLLLLLTLPIWGAMLLFPRTRVTQTLVLSYWPYIALGAIYAALLLTHLAADGLPSGFSYDALRQSLTGDWGLLAGFAHYLVLDLFAGVWLFRDAKYWGINPGVYLLATLLVAPIGLGAYLLLRQRRAKTDPARPLN